MLALDGPIFEANRVARSRPAGTGGQIADGTYFLTAVLEYSGAGGSEGQVRGSFYQSTLAVTGTRLDMAWRAAPTAEDIRTAPSFRSTSTFTTTGNILMDSDTCPVAYAPEPYPYSADATTLTFPITGSEAVWVYTKQ